MEKINVTSSSMPPFEEYVEKIKPLWDLKWLTNCGEMHNLLETSLEKYLDVKNVALMNNGHMALYNAIKSLNLKGEVITTPFTFVSTTNAIVQNGLTPVFCDIDPETCTINPKEIEKLITKDTGAIVAVHVYGNVCDVEAIEKIAKKYNLKVIYDAAHAFGVKYNGNSIANYGDVSMMSFHATKVFHTIEGGAVLFNDDNLKSKIQSLRNFGFVSQEEVKDGAMNCKMNEFQAAMGLCNLKYIDGEIEKRKKIVERYQKNLKEIKGIKCWEKQENVVSNYIYFPIFIDKDEFGIDRDELSLILEKNNIIARKYFYPITSNFECYKKYKTNTPIAEELSKKVLTLPLYSDLSLDNVDRICDIILKEGDRND